jgi:hypothetical protein
MLVLGPREIVDAVDVSPIPTGGEVTVSNVAPWLVLLFSKSVEFGVELKATTRKDSLLFLDSFFLGKESRLFEDFYSDDLAVDFVGVDFFRVGKDKVIEVCLLFLGSLAGVVLDSFSPGVSGDSPSAVSFNTKVIGTSDDSEETVFTPVGSPGISNDPVFDTIFADSVTNDRDIVVNIFATGSIVEDTASVVEEWSSIDTADNRASFVDFTHHGLFTLDWAIFVNTVDIVAIRNSTVFAWMTVSALDIIGTANTIIVTSSLVSRAGFIGNVVVVDVFVCSEGITTVTAHIGGLTGDQDLRGDVNIRPGGVSHDLNTIRHGGSGSKGPAGTTVLWNVLVTGKSNEVGSVNVLPVPVVGKVFHFQERRCALDKRFSELILDVARIRERASGDFRFVKDEVSACGYEKAQGEEDERLSSHELN